MFGPFFFDPDKTTLDNQKETVLQNREFIVLRDTDSIARGTCFQTAQQKLITFMAATTPAADYIQQHQQPEEDWNRYEDDEDDQDGY